MALILRPCWQDSAQGIRPRLCGEARFIRVAMAQRRPKRRLHRCARRRSWWHYTASRLSCLFLFPSSGLKPFASRPRPSVVFHCGVTTCSPYAPVGAAACRRRKTRGIEKDDKTSVGDPSHPGPEEETRAESDSVSRTRGRVASLGRTGIGKAQNLGKKGPKRTIEGARRGGCRLEAVNVNGKSHTFEALVWSLDFAALPEV